MVVFVDFCVIIKLKNRKEVFFLIMYKAVYENDEFEIILSENDNKALEEAIIFEETHGIIFNLFEIDSDYNEIRTIY